MASSSGSSSALAMAGRLAADTEPTDESLRHHALEGGRHQVRTEAHVHEPDGGRGGVVGV